MANMKKIFVASFWLCSVFLANGALGEQHPRVIVSTDIGGTDPDDFQSLVHLLIYADRLDLEGLISSPYGPGRKQHILDVIECYERDFTNLKTWSSSYPTPDALRAITKQGETEVAPYAGVRESTPGSQWIIQCARRVDKRPLNVLVWGGIEDVAQALHDAPDILPKLRVYYIGGPNKKWGPDAYYYIFRHHPELWIIESNATYRGWFTGGVQAGQFGNKEFVKQHIAGHGALGDFFVSKLDSIKMGDTPSVAWLLKGTPDNPTEPSWGGQYSRAWPRPYALFERMTTVDDQMEVFGILELALPFTAKLPTEPKAELIVDNQRLTGYLSWDTDAGDANTIEKNSNGLSLRGGAMRFRFSPKAATTYRFQIESNVASLNGLTGGIAAIRPSENAARHVAIPFPHWWTDILAADYAEGEHDGAKTINRWRAEYLADFAERMDRCRIAAPISQQP